MSLFRKKDKYKLSPKQEKEAKRWKMTPEQYIKFQHEANLFGLDQFEKEECVKLNWDPSIYYDEMYDD